ncbi:cytochrome P450 [Neolentinus lepideus HHB14362 ss-1]|uniref:Cytochrome P450 n=1 Tax=Neolentinus lepideus HHB14362 ss-1 TaxID=1314782 RepID=A0A165RIS1_9AGAM|nr:cytochrome P450 [Neolentinus lepideus HHB14362 ss-1]
METLEKMLSSVRGNFTSIQLVLLGVAGFVVFKIFFNVLLWPRFLSPLRKLPGPPLGNPVTGVFLEIARAEPGILQRDWVKAYGPNVRAVGPLGIERILLVKPEVLERTLVSEWLDCPRPNFMRNILGMAAGWGLLTVTGDEHKLMRKVMNPAFSIPNLMAQTDMYYGPIETLVGTLKSQMTDQGSNPGGTEFHIYDWVSKVALDIICETAFGYKCNSLLDPNNELAIAYEQLLNLQSGENQAKITSFIVLPGVPALLRSDWAYRHRDLFRKFPLTSPLTTMLDTTRRIRVICAEILASKIAESAVVGSSDTASKKDIMSLLLTARTSEDKEQGQASPSAYRMSDRELIEQMLTFLGAGHETTASGLAWTLYLLACNQEAQSKLRAEVSEVISTNPRPDYRTLKELKYLDCVVQEGLRVLPPVPITYRKAGRDLWFEGVRVPKGTLFTIPIRAINTWKEVWGDDAEEFRPERWLDLPPSYHPTFSTLSFLAGPHGCIGKTMAVMEMKAILAVLIANFEFHPTYEGQKAKPTATVTMKPSDAMPLKIKMVTCQ